VVRPCSDEADVLNTVDLNRNGFALHDNALLAVRTCLLSYFYSQLAILAEAAREHTALIRQEERVSFACCRHNDLLIADVFNQCRV